MLLQPIPSWEGHESSLSLDTREDHEHPPSQKPCVSSNKPLPRSEPQFPRLCIRTFRTKAAKVFRAFRFD